MLSQNVTCVVYDDGSIDDTSEKVESDFPQIKLLRNQTSKGYIYCRNKMLNETEADFAISLDDDAHFLTENPIEIISKRQRNNSGHRKQHSINLRKRLRIFVCIITHEWLQQ